MISFFSSQYCRCQAKNSFLGGICVLYDMLLKVFSQNMGVRAVEIKSLACTVAKKDLIFHFLLRGSVKLNHASFIFSNYITVFDVLSLLH